MADKRLIEHMRKYMYQIMYANMRIQAAIDRAKKKPLMLCEKNKIR